MKSEFQRRDIGTTRNVKHGDGIEGLRSLRRQSVDLIFADLPSGATRARVDRRLDLGAFWEAARHATKRTAAIVLMASNMRFAAEVVQSNLKDFRYDLVWRKNKSSGHLNANRMPLRAHEFLLVFYAEPPPYSPPKTTGHTPVNAFYTRTSGDNYGQARRVRGGGGSTLRYPTSVLDVPVVNNDDPRRVHPQQKPPDLAAWVISAYTKRGALVVDPCAGSGSTGIAAEQLGRRFLGWDLEAWDQQ